MLSEKNKTAYKNIFIAADHAGYELKNHLIGRFPFLPWRDLGTNSSESVDYPDFAGKLCLELKNYVSDSCGVLICGSGQGMAIKANRYPFIRAALCWTPEVAKLSRQHNNANVLTLGARVTSQAEAEEILQAFLQTDFEGGRHQRRVDKLSRKDESCS